MTHQSSQHAIVPPPPDRPDEAHKGTFGTVVVIGGCATMLGAPSLTASAAFRTGAGLVKIMTHASLLPHCLTIEPSATGILLPAATDEQAWRNALGQADDKTVFAVGPGMGTGAEPGRIVGRMLRQSRPVVLDADGLNNLAAMENPSQAIRCPLVVTPHPGEYRRLAERVGIEADPTDPAQRPLAAELLAQQLDAVVVLKGRHTVVCDGMRVYTNHTGNPALATAGSGDILTGMIASLIAQGMQRFDAAVLGVYLHGTAADIWAQQFGHAGMTAHDLAARIPQALENHRRGL